MSYINLFNQSKQPELANKNDSDSKFITLVRALKSKVDQNGGNMTGDLIMNNNRILNLADPMDNQECATKYYVDSITKTLQRNKGTKTLFNAPYEGDIETLCRVAEKLIIILNNSNLSYQHQLRKSFTYAVTMYHKYKSINDVFASNINEIANCSIFESLKQYTIMTIQDLPANLFDELKRDLVDLISNEKGTRKRYRKFLIKISEDRNISDKLRLLVNKNLLIIDIGFVYFIGSLLETLLQDLQ